MATIRMTARTRLRQLPTEVRDGLKLRAGVWADIAILHEATLEMEKKA
jgi:hypothetical protein